MNPILILAALFALGACRRGAPAATPPQALPAEARAWLDEPLPSSWPTPRNPGGEARIWLTYEPAVLNPLLDAGVAPKVVAFGLVQEPLLRFDPRQPERVIPALGTVRERSADGRILVLDLAEARFSDGARFTSADAVFTLNAVRDPANGCEVGAYFEQLEKVEALGPRAIRLTWKHPYAFAEHALALAPMQPAHAFPSAKQLRGTPAGRIPLGSGPYQIARWDVDDRVLLTRNPHYRGPAPALDRIVFRRATPDMALQLLQKGELDVIQTVYSDHAFAALAKDARVRERFRAIAFHDGSYLAAMLRADSGPLADVRVRRALAKTFPYEAHRSAVGLGVPALTRCPLYRGTSECDPALTEPAQDLAGAKQLLAEAGYAGKRISLAFLVPAHWRVPTWEVFQAHAAQAGFDVRIELADMATVKARWAEGSFDLSPILQWGFRDPYLRYHSRGRWNYTRYRDAETDRLLEAFRYERDPAVRAGIGRAFTRRYGDDVPEIPFWSRPWVSLISRDLSGVYPSREFLQPQDWWRATAAP